MKTRRVIPVIALSILAALPAPRTAAQSIDPAAYLEASRATVSLPRAMAMYNSYIDTAEPYLFGSFELNGSTGASSIPTVDGALGGTFMGVDAFIYLRLLKIGALSFRAIMLPSAFAFVFDDASKADFKSVYGTDKSLGWISGYALCGLQARRGEDRLTLGAVLRIEPEITAGPTPLFTRTRFADSSGASTETTSLDSLYADLSWRGWRLDSLLSAQALERIAAEKLFELAGKELELGPVLRYLGRAGSLQPGAAITWKPLPWLEASGSATAAIGKGALGLGDAELGLRLPFTLIKNIRKTGKDMGLILGLDASLASFKGEILAGARAEITVQNYTYFTWFDLIGLKYLATATAGYSWNYSESLTRMPFKDEPIVYFKIGAGYY